MALNFAMKADWQACRRFPGRHGAPADLAAIAGIVGMLVGDIIILWGRWHH